MIVIDYWRFQQFSPKDKCGWGDAVAVAILVSIDLFHAYYLAVGFFARGVCSVVDLVVGSLENIRELIDYEDVGTIFVGWLEL